MKKIIKYTLSIIFMAIGLIASISIVYNSFTNPELTNTELLIEFKYFYVVAFVCIVASVYVFDFFKNLDEL